ncbi:Ras GTP exchange factor [Entamoeba marina]
MRVTHHHRTISAPYICPHVNKTTLTCPYCSRTICASCFFASYVSSNSCSECFHTLKTEDITKLTEDSDVNTVFLESKRHSISVVASQTVASGSSAVSSSTFSSNPLSETTYYPNPDNNVFIPIDSFTVEAGTEGKIVQLATVEAMVGHMVSPDNSDPYFNECFVYSFPLVITPEQLMQLLCVRFDPFYESDVPWEDFKKSTLDPLRMKIVGFLRLWMKTRPDDFTGELLDKLKWIIQRFSLYKSKMASYLQKAVDALTEGGPLPKPLASVRLKCLNNGTSFLDYHPKDWAKQLSLIQQDYFNLIQMDEFLNQGWTGKDKEVQARYILKFVRFSNAITDSVSTAIVSFKEKQERALAIYFFITAANELRNHHNFDGMKSVLAGLASSSAFRLKESWHLVPETTVERYNEMDRLVASDGNFQLLRNTMKLASAPSIPFLGSTLTDLLFVNENKDCKDGLINFFKVRNIGNLIKEIRIKQTTRYNFPVDYALRQMIEEMPKENGDTLFEISLTREKKFRPSINLKEDKKRLEKVKKESNEIFKPYLKALKKL